MFFDDIAVVVVNRGAGHNTGLGSAGHCLGIDIIAGDGILNKASLVDPAVQQVSRLTVDTLIVDVDVLSQGGLCPVYGKK